MTVVSIHGRPGQGVETALNTIAKAAVAAGFSSQSLLFPEHNYVWGVVKIEKNPVLSKQVEQADFCLVFDQDISALQCVKDGGIIFYNTTQKLNPTQARKRRIKMFSLDASGISFSLTGKTFPNMAMLGALAKSFAKISMRALKTAAEQLSRESLLAVDEGYKNVKMVK